MKSKQIQLNNQVGLYMRLSQEDEREGESVSIENQKMILEKYAQERGCEIVDEYIDDGWSGTNFDRPDVQRLLEDAKIGRINTIIVKDLSRFGRNYIQVGEFVDYIFPAFGIPFIALNDNVDTGDRNSTGMDMMPIVNVFNEWHSASTSKKIRAVFVAKAKAGAIQSHLYPLRLSERVGRHSSYRGRRDCTRRETNFRDESRRHGEKAHCNDTYEKRNPHAV